MSGASGGPDTPQRNWNNLPDLNGTCINMIQCFFEQNEASSARPC